MDIRSWPIDRIMQLPDHCFGRRWPIGIGQVQTAIAAYYDISEAALPERCVLWRLYFWMTFYSTSEMTLSLSLGDALPTTDAEFDALESVVRDVGTIVAGRRTISIYRSPAAYELAIRMPIHSGGRRLVGRFEWTAAAKSAIYVNAVVSSIPTEVPEWLISGPGRGR